MPPKPNYSRTAANITAKTTKVATAQGAKVTTVATSNVATTSNDPDFLTIEVCANGKAGFAWEKGGKVMTVTRGGLADKSKLKTTYRLTKVGDDAISTDISKKDIGSLLDAARTSGKAYSVTFAAPGAEAAAAAAAGAAAAAAEGTALPTAAAEEKESTAEMMTQAEANAEADAALSPEEEAAAAAAAAAEAEAAAAAAEEARIAAEAAAVAAAAAAAEAERQRILRNGKAVILYNMYSDPFQLKDGVLTAAAIDEEYCLSDAMPNCQIHLSRISPVSEKLATYKVPPTSFFLTRLPFTLAVF